MRLIVTDLDGTLLDSSHQISPLTERALYEARSRGILLTVATGKTFPSTQELIRQFDIQIPVICGNGTIVHAPDGSILHEDPVPSDCAIEAIQMAHVAGLVPIIYSGSELITTKIDQNVELLMAHYEPMPRVIPDIERVIEHEYPSHKLILMQEADHALVTEFQMELERVFAGRAQVLRSGLPSVVELLPLGISKGTALDFILDYLDIVPQDVICFGDNFNDLEMILRAGIGVAMAHAPEEVRRQADYVTGTNDEDGVGQALCQLVLEH
jgi:Cof subfamily protein (haloacid dehalogenase superfamily)